MQVGIETDRGARVAALIAAGYEVSAEIVHLDRAHTRPVAGDSEPSEAIKLVARSHQSLI